MNRRSLSAGLVVLLLIAALVAVLLGARSCGQEGAQPAAEQTLPTVLGEPPTVLGEPLSSAPGGQLTVATEDPLDIIYPGVTAPASAEDAELIQVIDGDTIRVRMADGSEEKVRYIGIDAPEIAHPDSAGEYLGDEATARNAELLALGPLRLQTDVDERDDFGRLLAYVWAGGVFVNEMMVADGYARARNYPPNLTRQEDLWYAHDAAREAGIGIWGEPR